MSPFYYLLFYLLSGKNDWDNFWRIPPHHLLSVLYLVVKRRFLEKGSDDIESAVCYPIYTIYLSLCTQTAETTTSEPFSRIPQCQTCQIKKFQLMKMRIISYFSIRLNPPPLPLLTLFVIILFLVLYMVLYKN